jgi:hypothetical protein
MAGIRFAVEYVELENNRKPFEDFIFELTINKKGKGIKKPL